MKDQKEKAEDQIVSMLEKLMMDADDSYNCFNDENEASIFVDEPARNVGKPNTHKQNRGSNFKNAGLNVQTNYDYYPGHDFQVRGMNRKYPTSTPLTQSLSQGSIGNPYLSPSSYANFSNESGIGTNYYNKPQVNSFPNNNNYNQSNFSNSNFFNCNNNSLSTQFETLLPHNNSNNMSYPFSLQNSFYPNTNNTASNFSYYNYPQNLNQNQNSNFMNMNTMNNMNIMNMYPHFNGINNGNVNVNINLNKSNSPQKKGKNSKNNKKKAKLTPQTKTTQIPLKLKHFKININTPKNFSTNIPSNSLIITESLITEIEKLLSQADRIDEEIFTNLRYKFIPIIKTQSGSRIFQRCLKNTTSDIIHKIFLEIYESLNYLIIDNYANYFCHKFFGYLNKDDRFAFLKKIQSNLLTIASSKVGTYPVQGIIEMINSNSERQFFIENFKDSILQMCHDAHACHVIEKIITCFSEQSIKLIIDIIMNNFLTLANDNNGLCVVKKLIIHVSDKDLFKEVKGILTDNALNLIQHPYGNYIIQAALDYWKEEDVVPMLMKFANKYVNLSMQKYSSNVVEKCMEKSVDFGIIKFIEEVSTMSRIAGKT